jgi:hypothetical protein
VKLPAPPLTTPLTDSNGYVTTPWARWLVRVNSGLITTDQVSDIDGTVINAGTLDAAKITVGTITADRIRARQITVNEMAFTPISSFNFGLPYPFGDGSDGAVTIASNTNYANNTIKQFTNLTVNAGYTLGCSASANAVLLLFATGTVTINGTISVDGKGGAQNTDYVDSYGGSGGGGGGMASGSGGGGSDGGNTIVSGGAGGSYDARYPTAGGNGDDIGSTNITYFRLRDDLKRYCLGSWGTGGGEGGLYPGSTGAAGGHGGGVVIIFADVVSIGATGVITADGANGANASVNNSGGGGGGGGGFIWIVARSYTSSGSVAASGGTGGAGNVDGAAGGDGGAGTVIIDVIPW